MRVGLLWHNVNSRNYGVSALAVSHIYILSKLVEKNCNALELTTIGTTEDVSLNIRQNLEKELGIKINHVDYSLKKLLMGIVKLDFSLFSIFGNFDLVLDIGEGDSLSDIYGWKRLLTLLISKSSVLWFGKTLVLSPQTIGPFRSRFAAYLCSRVLKKCDCVFARDYKSYSLLKELGVVRSEEVVDLAFNLPFDQLPKKSDAVGVNVSGLLWNGGYSGNNQFNLKLDYKSLMIDLVTKFRERGKDVYLVSHVISDVELTEDDFRACIQVKDRFVDDDGVRVAPKFDSPMAAKTFISQLEFFTGSRMHATIASLSAEVPMIPIAYSRKFSGLFGGLGYDFTIDAFETSNSELLDRFFDLYDNHFPKMEQDCKKSICEAKERLGVYSKKVGRYFEKS